MVTRNEGGCSVFGSHTINDYSAYLSLVSSVFDPPSKCLNSYQEKKDPFKICFKFFRLCFLDFLKKITLICLFLNNHDTM